MADELIGVAELTRKLKLLGDPKQQRKALRQSVTVPMRRVMKAAKINLERVSPGVAEFHKTYTGRIVTRGFAQRSVRLRVSVTKKLTAAFAKLGVLKEAYYAVSFFERGTAKLGARPWLVPAFEVNRENSLRLVGQTLKENIEKIAKSGGGAAR